MRAEDPQFSRVQWHQDLGWDSKMLERLDALKTVLDAKPAAALEQLLVRMSGLRREWKKQEQAKPAASGDKSA